MGDGVDTFLREWEGLGAAWHLPGGPVGPPARWATTSKAEGGSGTEEEEALGPIASEGGLYSD